MTLQVQTGYLYDDNGNRIEKDPHTLFTTGTINDLTEVYTYDLSNRLIHWQNDAGNSFDAYHDARTRRVAKTEYDGSAGTTKTTFFRYDGGTNFQELWANPADFNQVEVMKELVRAGGLGGGIGSVLYSDETMAPNVAGPWEGFIYNATGDSTVLTDSSGVATQKNLYGAFGDTVITDGGSDNNRLRNTKERDSSTGLDDDGFRYYDQSTGRYIQRDPSGYSDGLNVYLSDHDDPVNKVDPQGLESASNSFTGGLHAIRNLLFWGQVGDPEPTTQRAVQNTFDTSNWDRSHGTGDAVLSRASSVVHTVTLGAVDRQSSMGGFTFDASNRASADRTAGAIIDTDAILISGVTGVRSMQAMGRALEEGGPLLRMGLRTLSTGQTVPALAGNGAAWSSLGIANLSGAVSAGSAYDLALGKVNEGTGGSPEGKCSPNPDGQHGKPDHRATVADLADQAAGDYPDDIIHQGTSIKTKTGVNRRPDVWVEDSATGDVKQVYEAARTNKDGTFVSRERAKASEYDRAGIKSEFRKVE